MIPNIKTMKLDLNTLVNTPDLEKEWQIIGKAFKSNMYYKGDIPSELDKNLSNLCPN